MSARFRLRFFLFACCTVDVAQAHDPGLSTALMIVRADRIELDASFAPADVHSLLRPAARPSGKWSDADFAIARVRLEELAAQLWELRMNGNPLIPLASWVKLVPGDRLDFHLSYPRPAPGSLEFRARKLSAFSPGHREYFLATDEGGPVLAQKLLSANAPAIDIPLGPVASKPAPSATEPPPEKNAGAPTFWGFLKLGVEHIWTGYDHLLFLFGLLVVCRTFKSIVAITSCFTLAHSITLALATLNVVNLPSRFVEPAIAASIIFVGVENLGRRGAQPKGRWAVTFFFGLIHGFGFASVLRALGVGEGGRSLAMPLFTFNLGVELGQIAVAGIVLPIVWQLRKNDAFVRRGVPALSIVVAMTGLYWLLERTVFS
ncbi:MAG: HupE/UreJ family protein [Opitutaceae bacterium]|nr:HupE/UreJ family protein [Opitutaceae bacterium]